MIKFKLIDPTKKSKEVQEYVIDERGAVMLSRNYNPSNYKKIPRWLDYRENIKERVVGYLQADITRSMSDGGDIRSKTDLFSVNNNPNIGLCPLILKNGLFRVEADIPTLSIEDIVADFDVDSIPKEEIESVKR